MKKILIAIFLILSTLNLVSQDSTRILNQIEIIAIKTKHNDTIYGIDVSFYQGRIDWSKIDSNIRFSIMKASEGIYITDYRFKYNWDNCNITKGAYHFFRPQYSGEKQGRLFLSLITIDTGDIRPVIDVEYTPYWILKRHRKIAIKNLSKMINYIEEKTKVKPIIYTSTNFWNKYLSSDYNEQDHVLWVADFRNQGPPNLNWTIWQYTPKGKVTGIRTMVDKNITLNIDSLLVK